MTYGTPRKEQCGVCGGNGQKVCWECHESDTTDLYEKIDENTKEIQRLTRLVKILLDKNGLTKIEVTP